MEHVVFYTAADGSPAYRRTANLDDAVRVVEHLRNAEGREEVHVYSLAPVALNFRPYYRVELNANAPIPAQAEPQAPAFSAPAPAPAYDVSAELASAASAAEPAHVEPTVEHAAAAQQELPPPPQQFAAPAAQAVPAPDPMGAFMPMSPIAAPMPPAPEQQPALAAVGQADTEESADQNGQARGARGLGFFTR